MTRLNDQQKELVFDYCMGLANPEEAVEARSLICSNKEAEEIHSRVQATLAPLQSLLIEDCPQHLVDSTISHLNTVAASSTDRLRQLIDGEQRRKVPAVRWHWLGAIGKLATAAVFVIAASVLFTTFNYMRYDSLRQRCKLQQAGERGFFNALRNYMTDHDGIQPAVAVQAGAPWYKIGYQGNENHSNTRKAFMLVKNG